MRADVLDTLVDELLKVVKRISNTENATPEELEALARVADVIARVML